MQTLSVDRVVGQVLGSYRVERLLGQGRLSAVYFAQNTLTSINGALTLFIVPERFSPDARARFIQRFRKEANGLMALQHPHVLPVHEYGEHQGHPYLVTPYMTNGSLADIIKRDGRCEYTDVLDILEQMVAGLEYAHSRGVIHGTLKPSNIVLGDDQNLLVAGFGLMHMLQMRGVEPDNRPYGHLLSIADTFLAAPEYIAPEIVQGQSIDKRSDIYALGIILFELLSGKPPFTGQKPLDVAKMHVEQPIPSLRTLYPAIPMAVVSVVNQALDRDPTRRFQSVSELAEAFAQAAIGASGSMRRLDQRPRTSSKKNNSSPETPPNGYSTSSWQFMPPIVTGKLEAMNAATARKSAPIPSEPSVENEDPWQFMPPVVTGNLETPHHSGYEENARTKPTTSREYRQEPSMAAPPVKPRVPAPPTLVPQTPEPTAQRLAASMPPVEPIASVVRENNAEEKRQEWWEQAPQKPLVLGASESNPWGDAPTWAQPVSTSQRSGSTNRRSRNNTMGRRKVVALLATGGVIAAGVLVGVKLTSGSHSATTTATTQSTGNTTTAPTTSKQTAKTNGGTATKQPQATNTGTVIGSTAMAPNSSVVFNNNQDLLIRLTNGNFVAYNRACTHEQVPINYDPATKTMICPAHGAIFDPAQNAKVLLGPATTPVAAVKVSVNSNGTITMV
jgi:serine/threonine protein kinase/nitrite reductase/ring-hydroxylating ferredoxin subunit